MYDVTSIEHWLLWFLRGSGSGGGGGGGGGGGSLPAVTICTVFHVKYFKRIKIIKEHNPHKFGAVTMNQTMMNGGGPTNIQQE